MLATPDPTRHSAETQLAAAVVMAAVSDLFLYSKPGVETRDPHRQDAMAFLTDKSGAWVQSRDAWCAMCGIEPGVLRDRIIQALNGDDALAAQLAMYSNQRGQLSHFNKEGISQARDMWTARIARLNPAPKPRPKPTPTLPRVVGMKQKPLPRWATNQRAILRVLDQPKTFQQIVDELTEFYPDNLLKALERLCEMGRVEEKGGRWFVPKVPVVACAG